MNNGPIIGFQKYFFIYETTPWEIFFFFFFFFSQKESPTANTIGGSSESKRRTIIRERMEPNDRATQWQAVAVQ